MKNRDRDEIIRVVSTRYSSLPQNKWTQCSSCPPEHAFFSSESRGRSGARRGHVRNRGGGRGSSRGGNSCCGGGSHSSSSSASGNKCGSQGSNRGNDDISTSGSVSSGDIPAPRGTEARRLQHVVKPPELQSGRTGSQSQGWTLSHSCTDALLTYARTGAKEAEETERVHDLLLEESLEEEREWLDELQDDNDKRHLSGTAVT